MTNKFILIFTTFLGLGFLGWLIFVNQSEEPAPNFTLEYLDPDQYTIPKQMTLDNQEVIPLNWTDNNENENLIIQSDRKYYSGNNQSIVYFSITNISPQDQDMEINFLFDQEEQRGLRTLSKITNSKFQNPNKLQITNSKQAQDTIQSGQTNFYLATIYYPTNSQGEFFIEASGDKGGYGYLDPYYAGGLVGYWSFDGDDIDWASNTAYDRSGNGNNGTMTNMDSFNASVRGKSGQALDFDGVNDYVNFSSNNMTGSGNPANESFAMWLKLTSSPASSQGIFEDGNALKDTVPQRLLQCKATGEIRALPCNISYTTYTTSGLVVGEWAHVVWTRQGSVNKIYFNGVEEVNYSVVATCSMGPELHIGVGYNAYFPGQIDEVRIYNRALSADEVKRLYDVGARKFITN